MTKHSKIFFAVLTIIFVFTVITAPVYAQGVTLSITPSGESDAGETITFEATPVEVENPEYRFGWRLVGGSWTATPAQSGNIFTATVPANFGGGNMELGVQVREAGTTAWLATDTKLHTINAVSPAVELTVTPAGESEPGENIVLSASTAGIANPEFQFGYRSATGSWQLIGKPTTIDTRTLPVPGNAPPGQYQLGVQVREAGRNAWLHYAFKDHVLVGEVDPDPDSLTLEVPEESVSAYHFDAIVTYTGTSNPVTGLTEADFTLLNSESQVMVIGNVSVENEEFQGRYTIYPEDFIYCPVFGYEVRLPVGNYTLELSLDGYAEVSTAFEVALLPELWSNTEVYVGEENPSIVIDLYDATFNDDGSAQSPANWAIDFGDTNLTLGTIVRDDADQVTFYFIGTAAEGSITFKARSAALSGARDSRSYTHFISNP